MTTNWPIVVTPEVRERLKPLINLGNKVCGSQLFPERFVEVTTLPKKVFVFEDIVVVLFNKHYVWHGGASGDKSRLMAVVNGRLYYYQHDLCFCGSHHGFFPDREVRDVLTAKVFNDMVVVRTDTDGELSTIALRPYR